MEYAALGRSGLKISRVGFGCAAIGGYDYGPVDDAKSISAIRAALDHGITLFDTADVYGFGRSERVLSEGLGDDRGNVVIATKGGVRWDERGRTSRDLSPAYLTAAIDDSLRRLRIDCVPLYQLHWPDGSTPLADALGAVERARDAGKIAAIGVCNFPMNLLEADFCAARLDAYQVAYSLLQRESEDALRACSRQYGLATLCYNVLAQGLFSGKYDRESTFTGTDLRTRSALFRDDRFDQGLEILDRLKATSAQVKRPTSQVAIRWLLECDWVTSALTGIKTTFQAAENAAAAGWSLAASDAVALGAPRRTSSLEARA